MGRAREGYFNSLRGLALQTGAGGCTPLQFAEVLCVSALLVPVTVSAELSVGVPAEAETVMVVVPLPVLKPGRNLPSHQREVRWR